MSRYRHSGFSLLKIVSINIALSVDNAVVIALASRPLPQPSRRNSPDEVLFVSSGLLTQINASPCMSGGMLLLEWSKVPGRKRHWSRQASHVCMTDTKLHL